MRYRGLLLAAALLFATGGVAIKGNDLTAWQVASFRSGVAAVALALMIPSSRRGWKWSYVPVAFAFAATLLLFVLATKRTTAANAIFLQSTAPLYLLVIGPVFLRERLRRSDILLAAAVAGGMSLIFLNRQPAAVTAPDPLTGDLLGAGAGLAWALTLAGLRLIGRSEGHGVAMGTVVLGNAIAFAVALPFAFPVASFDVSDSLAVLYLGIVQIGLAYVCLTQALRHVPVFEASAIVLVEPAINPLWAWLLLNERPSNWALAGGCVILSATLVNGWWQNRPGKQANEGPQRIRA